MIKTAMECDVIDEDLSRFDSQPQFCGFESPMDPSSPRPSRFFEEAYVLEMGRLCDAVHGLEVRMCVDADSAKYYGRISRGIEGIEEEFKEFCSASPLERKVVMDLFEYV